MADLRQKLSDFGYRRIAFTVLVLIALLIYVGLVQGWKNQLFLVTSWIGGVGIMPEEFLAISHRLHEVAFALVFWPIIIGLLAQFRSPKRHVAAMYMALIGLASLLVAFAITNYWQPAMILVFLGVPIVLAAILHPSGRDLINWVDIDRVNRVLLVLVVIAAIPLLAFTANQVGLQTGAIEPSHDHGHAGHDEEAHEEHVKFGHFTLVVGLLLGVIGLGLLASLQPTGWWLSAWVAGLMVAVFGIAGLLAPEAASNPGLLWNILAIIWAVVFVGAAELTQDPESPTPLGP